MDNNKLLKFLYKDIAEIEELVAEKGAAGFDKFEIDFIQSRFTGAKQLIQILNEKENGGSLQSQSQSQSEVVENVSEQAVVIPKPDEKLAEPVLLSEEEQESLQELSDFEEELKEGVSVQSQSQLAEDSEQATTINSEEEESGQFQSQSQEERVEDEPTTYDQQPITKTNDEPEVLVEESRQELQVDAEPRSQSQTAESQSEVEEDPQDAPTSVVEQTASSNGGADVELESEGEIDDANNRLGDTFSKEKSVNELLGKTDNDNLEYKISHSPLANLNAAIGINDRYQYIRELFEGSADKFAETVGALDELSNIQEAVSYLQQNHKWKKNEISLKFVNLVKRRFPNG